MKITIDAKGKEILALAKAGLLKGAKVLERKPAKRRQLSKQTEAVLKVRLDQLRAYKEAFGSFDVPRSGPYADLGEWLDSLRETYVNAPDGYRIRYLKEHAPDLLQYLATWASKKITKTPVRNAPFWLAAAWVADFMELRLNAPSQASLDPNEVALAKWLSRWTRAEALESLRKTAGAYEVAAELAELAQMLRSRDRTVVDKARARLKDWRKAALYQRLAAMCGGDAAWMSGQRMKEFTRSVDALENFWPSRRAWGREQAVWVVKKG